MEKEIKIVAPDGYEIDKEKSSFDRIVFKKRESIQSYEDVFKKLIKKNPWCYINSERHPSNYSVDSAYIAYSDIVPTKDRLEWLMALNKLRNTALVLNDGWKPDWNDDEMDKFSFTYHHPTNKLTPCLYREFQVSAVYFKTKELALKAVELLGEEIVKKALGVYLID